MKKNRKVVLKANKSAITKFNLERIFDKSLEFIGFAIGIIILMFFINSVKDLDGYFKDRDYLLQLLKDENVDIVKSNVCKDIKEEGNNFTVNTECNAKDILRKRIDDNIFGFLLPDKFKQDQLPKKLTKLIPTKHKNRFRNLGDGPSLKQLEKALSIKIKTKETKISTIENENKPVDCLEGDCWNNFSKKQYSNGYYIGEFNNGKKNGQGTYILNDGEKYIGDWKDDNRTGQGTFIWNSGAKYTGDYIKGERTGKGTMNYSDGDKYTGDFLKGERHGKGILIGSSGNKYEGDFKKNKREGRGIFIWAGGDKYFGEFIQNKMTGEATLISNKDNSTMVGKFEDSQLIDGFVILPGGIKFRALRENGKLKYGSIQNSNQNIDLLAQQLKRNNDLQTSRMLLDISKSLMGSRKNSSSLNLNNSNLGGGFLSGSSSSGMYKTCSYSSGLGTRTKTVFASAPCPMAY